MALEFEDEAVATANIVQRAYFSSKGFEPGFIDIEDFDKNSNEVKIENWLCENDPSYYAPFFAGKTRHAFVSLSSSPRLGATTPLYAFRPENEQVDGLDGEENEEHERVRRTPEPEQKYLIKRPRFVFNNDDLLSSDGVEFEIGEADDESSESQDEFWRD